MKDFHCWWGKWVGGKPRGQKGSWVSYKHTLSGGRLHKMNVFNRMDEVCTHKCSFLSHGKQCVFPVLLLQSNTCCFLCSVVQLTAQKDEVQSTLTYVWFRHQDHLGPVPKLTEVNEKPATHPGDSESEPESIFHLEFLIYYGVGVFSIFIILCFLIASLLVLPYYTNVLIPQFPTWQTGKWYFSFIKGHQRGIGLGCHSCGWPLRLV